jgi:hypothetical protein
MPPRLQQLDEIEDRIWGELDTCVEPRPREHAPHEWRVAVLATLADDGKPDARSIVLREVESSERQLIFYTDARSPKVRQIASAPEGTLIFWSPALGWQLRMHVRLAVEDSGLAVSSRWARLQTSAGAAEYLAAAAPGSELDAPLVDLGSRSHFAMIRALVESVDWLELHPGGQRRALFGHGGPKWLQP